MVVVSDSSIITGLLALNKIQLLNQLFEHVIISNAVYLELQSLESFNYDISPLKEDWIVIENVEKNEMLDLLLKRLDIGEAESIILSIQHNADYLLIDEKKGRRIASSLGIKVIGLLGVLIQAKWSGLIPALKPLLQELTIKLDFRLSKDLIDKALDEVNEK